MKRDATAGYSSVFLMASAWVALLLTGCVNVSDRKADSMDVFILAGQSNMAGRGVVEEFDRLVWPRVFTLDQDGQWIVGVDPLHSDKPQAGVGPGLTFGRIVADARPGRRIGLVPSAHGGSPIEAWQPGADHAQTKAHPYDDAIGRARRALREGRLRAILWIQGESDASAERAPLYYERLKTLIAGLRRDLKEEDVPFIIGRLPRFTEEEKSEWRAQITEAQRRVARELRQVYFVEMPVLTSLPDRIHADAPSAREMGRRLAEAYLQMRKHED